MTGWRVLCGFWCDSDVGSWTFWVRTQASPVREVYLHGTFVRQQGALQRALHIEITHLGDGGERSTERLQYAVRSTIPMGLLGRGGEES
jgi:hypothetical protein